MSRISRLDRSEVTPGMAALYDKAFAQRGNVPNMFRVMAHRPEIFATMQAHFGAVLNTGTVSNQAEGTDHRPHQPGEPDALLPGQPHHSGQRAGLERRPTGAPGGVARSARTLPPPKRPPCGWPRPSPATPTRSATSSLPSCAASTPKARLWSCSAPSACSTTSTASTTPCGWSRPSPARAAARRRRRKTAAAQ